MILLEISPSKLWTFWRLQSQSSNHILIIKERVHVWIQFVICNLNTAGWNIELPVLPLNFAYRLITIISLLTRQATNGPIPQKNVLINLLKIHNTLLLPDDSLLKVFKVVSDSHHIWVQEVDPHILLLQFLFDLFPLGLIVNVPKYSLNIKFLPELDNFGVSDPLDVIELLVHGGVHPINSLLNELNHLLLSGEGR